jgi:hypothetical protein
VHKLLSYELEPLERRGVVIKTGSLGWNRTKLKGIGCARHVWGVRTALCLLPFFTAVLWADEAADRLSINSVIEALNDPARRASLFTKDADTSVDFDHLIGLHKKSSFIGGTGGNESWTVLTKPRVAGGPIRFVTPDVATVDGASTVMGAVTIERSVPLLFVVKREGSAWRISTVRVVRSLLVPLLQ